MKKLSFIIAMAFLMMGVVACDIIEEPYKKENNGGGGNTGGGETPDPEQVVKHVLLEDYTGVLCNNCPAAGQLALDIQERYDHKVVVLGVHAGDMAAFPPLDFRTPEGEEWWNFFSFQQNPVGTINRKIVNGGYAFDSPSWEDAVAEAIQEEATVDMNAEVSYNDENRELKVDVVSKFLTEMPDTYTLTVCIMEDSIVGMQQGQSPNYVHRHVFRGTIDNKAWGTVLNQTAVAPEEEFTNSYTATLNETFNADQCYIIAYVANEGTKEVLQVVEKKIK